MHGGQANQQACRTYQPRAQARTVLQLALEEGLPAFLAEAQELGGTDEDVDRLLRKVVRKVWKVARAKYPDGLPCAEDAKAALASASVQARLPLGEEESPPPPQGRRCAFLEGLGPARQHRRARE